MSDIENDIQAALASVQNEQSQEGNENQQTSNVDGEQTNNQPPAEVDEWLTAPASYTTEMKDLFPTLPLNVRKYLTERESQMEKGMSSKNNQLQSYKWVDNVFSPQDMQSLGYNNAQECAAGLMSVVRGLNSNPAETLAYLNEIYGQPATNNNNDPSQGFQNRMMSMQRQLDEQNAFLRLMQQNAANEQVRQFVSAKDEKGNSKYPYYEQAKPMMTDLLKSGLSKSLEDAYDCAIWMSPEIRDKIIAEQNKQVLASKLSEAEKAKTASFSPTSKEQGEFSQNETAEETVRRMFKQMG